jgi:hypothetical protein
MKHEIDLSKYDISGDRLVAFAQEFGGELRYVGDSRETAEIHFTAIEGFLPHDLQQRFLRALQSYRQPPY